LVIEEINEKYGRFVAEPFERGYGTTVGIALRRALLSLIEGAAVTAIRIDGILHEFSVIKGVYEDVLNIILNIKSIPFKLNTNERKVIRISKNGEGELLSSDIETDSDLEVLDKNVHIAYLENGADLNIEFIVEKNVGYKFAEQNINEELPLDFIAVDSNFNPIEKVNYSVLPARVGKRTDYEKLILEIWTNGSVRPEDTVSKAGKILRDHMAIFLNSQDNTPAISEVEEEVNIEMEKKVEFLERTVESLGLSVRALKCLKRLSVEFIYELIEKTEHELLNSKNFGKKSLEEIIQRLSEIELTLGQKVPKIIKEKMEKKLKTQDEEENEE
jgi:DNA-directed RNA polymerase subunit alpha